jgi:GNAT superfamily N-acetyltransferase
VNYVKLFEEFTANQVTCDNCGWSWRLEEGGDDTFICHDCGHDNSPMLGEEFILQDLEKKYEIVLDLWDNGDYLELGKLEIAKSQRGKGIGSEVMQKIVDYADQVGKDIRLTPSTDFGATSVNRLKKFYGKFGFVKNKDLKYKDSMVRFANI